MFTKNFTQKIVGIYFEKIKIKNHKIDGIYREKLTKIFRKSWESFLWNTLKKLGKHVKHFKKYLQTLWGYFAKILEYTLENFSKKVAKNFTQNFLVVFLEKKN